jgi:hypothetical protein
MLCGMLVGMLRRLPACHGACPAGMLDDMLLGRAAWASWHAGQAGRAGWACCVKIPSKKRGTASFKLLDGGMPPSMPGMASLPSMGSRNDGLGRALAEGRDGRTARIWPAGCMRVHQGGAHATSHPKEVLMSSKNV